MIKTVDPEEKNRSDADLESNRDEGSCCIPRCGKQTIPPHNRIVYGYKKVNGENECRSIPSATDLLYTLNFKPEIIYQDLTEKYHIILRDRDDTKKQTPEQRQLDQDTFVKMIFLAGKTYKLEIKYSGHLENVTLFGRQL